MNENTIKTFRNDTARCINDGRLCEAFAAMRQYGGESRRADIVDDIAGVEADYERMLHYMSQGVVDPDRAKVLDDIKERARAIVDVIARELMIADGASLYYSTVRFLARNRGTIQGGIEALLAEAARVGGDLAGLVDERRNEGLEAMAVTLFNRVWTSHPLTAGDAVAIVDFVRNERAPQAVRADVVAAVMLGAMEFYDRRRLEILLDIYTTDGVGEVLRLRAFIGLCLFMFRYRRRALPRELMLRLESVKELPEWKKDFAVAAIEFMRTRDTARISDKITNEILPTLTRLAPEMRQRLGDEAVDMDAIAGGENPEWEALLRRDGLGDKLREMSEIQSDGGDVYMSSFASLKTFPFFREAANWFLPFDLSHTEVVKAENSGMPVGELIARMPMLCDSDKYSVMMALASTPASMREAAMKGMSMQGNQMYEMLSEIEKVSPDTSRKTVIGNYLRDIYRFYNLFRRKDDFFNPFAHGVDLMEIKALSQGFDDIDTLVLVAEFDIKHHFWEEALSVLARIDNLSDPEALRAQKRGYCYERLGQWNKAVAAYEEAEMLGGGSQWLLRHMAGALRCDGNPSRAIAVYKRLSEIEEENAATALAMGRTYLEAHRPVEAEAQYYKAFYLAPDDRKAVRGLAWTLMLNRKYEAADKHYATVLADSPTAEDYLNAAHNARGLGDMSRAISLYAQAYVALDKNADRLAEMLADDAAYLAQAGIDNADNNLIVEAIRYRFANN